MKLVDLIIIAILITAIEAILCAALYMFNKEKLDRRFSRAYYGTEDILGIRTIFEKGCRKKDRVLIEEALAEIPEKIRKNFSDEGYYVKVMPQKKMKKEHKGKSNKCAGFFSSKRKKIVLNANAHTKKLTLWHEFGHFIDYQCGMLTGNNDKSSASDEEMLMFLRKERKRIFSRIPKYYKQNTAELFAYAVSNYFAKDYKNVPKDLIPIIKAKINVLQKNI